MNQSNFETMHTIQWLVHLNKEKHRMNSLPFQNPLIQVFGFLLQKQHSPASNQEISIIQIVPEKLERSTSTN